MDLQLLESLLYQEESEALDFKIQQYPFSEATDEQKSELLKDILAFANAWRQTDAYILIGVQEVIGGRSIARGIDPNDHLLKSKSSTVRPQQDELAAGFLICPRRIRGRLYRRSDDTFAGSAGLSQETIWQVGSGGCLHPAG